MLAYAAGRPVVGNRRASPNSMLFIASAHVIALAALMSAKMDLPAQFLDPPLIVDTYRVPPEPLTKVDPVEPNGSTTLDPGATAAADPQIEIPLPPLSSGPALSDTGPSLGPSGPSAEPFPRIEPRMIPVTSGAVLISSPAELRPPYPRSKLLSEEEASLTLKLTIDERGRVVAVDPVGRADRIFLAAARAHLLAHWRYRPAMADGRATGSTLITTLHFRIDG
ncbi:MAG: energy transducer TonB [Sphingomicrobium sp.]